ncbi:MAG: hypothetical protein ACRERE_17160 [Candidatus Entotheonellia bacterium]
MPKRFEKLGALSVAELLKAVQYLGYFPDDLQQVPEAVRTFIAHQLQLLWDHPFALELIRPSLLGAA